MTNPRHPNPIHENQSFPWAERQNPNLIHENRPFSWTKPPSQSHGMAQVRFFQADLRHCL